MRTAPRTASDQERLEKMRQLVEEARAIGRKPLREQVAVPHPLGGYRVIVRTVETEPE